MIVSKRPEGAYERPGENDYWHRECFLKSRLDITEYAWEDEEWGSQTCQGCGAEVIDSLPSSLKKRDSSKASSGDSDLRRTKITRSTLLKSGDSWHNDERLTDNT